MPKKNDFKLDVVSVRLVKDAPIYSEHTFNNPADIAAVMGDCMCQFDREVVCVVNLRSDLKPIVNQIQQISHHIAAAQRKAQRQRRVHMTLMMMAMMISIWMAIMTMIDMTETEIMLMV